jgi:hypothetical protein
MKPMPDNKKTRRIAGGFSLWLMILQPYFLSL